MSDGPEMFMFMLLGYIAATCTAIGYLVEAKMSDNRTAMNDTLKDDARRIGIHQWKREMRLKAIKEAKSFEELKKALVDWIETQ